MNPVERQPAAAIPEKEERQPEAAISEKEERQRTERYSQCERLSFINDFNGETPLACI